MVLLNDLNQFYHETPIFVRNAFPWAFLVNCPLYPREFLLFSRDFYLCYPAFDLHFSGFDLCYPAFISAFPLFIFKFID